MKIMFLLKEAIKKNIITPSDFYFSISIAQNQSPKTILSTICISYFTRIGHTCLPISILENKKVFNKKNHTKLINSIWKTTELSHNFQLELLKNKVIGNEFLSTPLIIFNKKIYLNKIWIAEKKIFNFISQDQNNETKNLIVIKKKITFLLCNNTETLQKIAIILSILNKVTFIMGGPGTGKTTIAFKILIAILTISNKKLNIQLTAPTGKAANRLTESIKTSISIFSHLYKNSLLIKPAITLHRLLGINIDNTLNIKKLDHISEIDVLIVDESSMIDIFTMEKLIDNISKKTKIIFLGDHNQLPSINCGHILKDIHSYYCNGYSQSTIKKINFFDITDVKKIKKHKFSNISDKICILKKNYRFHIQSNISKISNKIKKNKFNDFQKLFCNMYKDVNFHCIDTIQDYKKMILNLTENNMNYWRCLNKKTTPIEIISNLNNYRLICVLQEGPFGVKGLNSELENEMKNRGLIKTIIINKNIIYFGQPILILKNDYNLQLYNGDSGIIIYDDKEKLQACFFINDKKIKFIPINLLPKFQTNWAMTVHKSQGSEFCNVALVLPNIYSEILTQELVYTAITRAKNKLTIYSNKTIFKKSIKNKTIRYSGLSINECFY